MSASPTEILPIYMHFHGGGFLFGTLSSEDAICSRLAVNTHVVVINVNYRHTPEYTYPAAWNDAEDAFVWVCENIARLNGDPDKIVVGGISAGAWLAASLTVEIKAPSLANTTHPWPGTNDSCSGVHQVL